LRQAIAGDPRLTLLAMAGTEGHSAKESNTLAQHIEGQQILNMAAHRVGAGAPLYFGFYLLVPGSRPAPVEVQIKRDPPTRDSRSGDSDDIQELVVTIRVKTARLGGVEAKLARHQERQLRVELCAERSATLALMRRNAPSLGQALVALGWDVRRIRVTSVRQFGPLWFGGDTLNRPRTRINWRA
jgi:hypothetical protein